MVVGGEGVKMDGSPQNRKHFHLFQNIIFKGSNAAPKGQVHKGLSTWTL